MRKLVKDKLNVLYHGQSDIGLIRTENQDSYAIFPAGSADLYSGKGQMFIVADGVGGHTGGKEASSLAVETISNYFFNSRSANVSETLRKAIEDANAKIFQRSANSEKLSRMATTSTVLILKESMAVIGHVGDSKIFKTEDNNIEQLTQEHTQYNEMLRDGLLNEKEAKNFPRKSVLSRALGASEKTEVDIIDNIPLKNSQNFLLCSDGLSNVSKEEIRDIISRDLPEDACNKLIMLANERGGKDNVTVIVVKITASKTKFISKHPDSSEKMDRTVKQASSPLRRKSKGSTAILSMVIIFFILILLFGSMVLDLIKSVTGNSENISTQPEQVYTNIDEKEFDIANQLFSTGQYKKALASYQNVLTREPMHLGALDGINKIVAVYSKEAEKLRRRNDFESALAYYLQIDAIKPGQEEIRNLIEMCRSKISSGLGDSIRQQ